MGYTVIPFKTPKGQWLFGYEADLPFTPDPADPPGMAYSCTVRLSLKGDLLAMETIQESIKPDLATKTVHVQGWAKDARSSSVPNPGASIPDVDIELVHTDLDDLADHPLGQLRPRPAAGGGCEWAWESNNTLSPPSNIGLGIRKYSAQFTLLLGSTPMVVRVSGTHDFSNGAVKLKGCGSPDPVPNTVDCNCVPFEDTPFEITKWEEANTADPACVVCAELMERRLAAGKIDVAADEGTAVDYVEVDFTGLDLAGMKFAGSARGVQPFASNQQLARAVRDAVEHSLQGDVIQRILPFDVTGFDHSVDPEYAVYEVEASQAGAVLLQIRQLLRGHDAVERVNLAQDLESDARQEAAVRGRNPFWGQDMLSGGVKPGPGHPEVTIAVIGTGVDLQHECLQLALTRYNAGGYKGVLDFTWPNDDIPLDENGHGTEVAALISGADFASGTRGVGLAPGCSLLPIRISAGIGGKSSLLAAAITQADSNGAHIIVLTHTIKRYAASPAFSVVKAACASAAANGCLIFAAAGSSAAKGRYPAAWPGIVCSVGAIDEQLEPVPGTRVDGQVDLVAPGVGIQSLELATLLYSSDRAGTSYSAPLAAAVAAQFLSAAMPRLGLRSGAQLKNFMQKNRGRQRPHFLVPSLQFFL